MRDIKIIASSISNLTDARYFAAKIVDAISFDLSKVNRDEYFAIKDWVEGVAILLETDEEFSDLEIHEADGIIYNVQDGFQNNDVLSNSTIVSASKSILETLPDPSGHIIRNHSWDQVNGDSKQLIIDFAFENQCYLDVSLSLDELESIIESEKLFGIVCRGGDEEKVGYKSFDELDDMFDLMDD
jgi:phosphoribosylanthranilate isomerase